MSELEEYADGLVALGGFIKSHQELFLAKSAWRPDATEVPDALTVNVMCLDAADLAAKVRAMGSGEKYSDAFESGIAFTGVRKEFGPHVVDVYVPSDRVCTPKRTEMREKSTVRLTDEARAQIEAIRAAHTVTETAPVVLEWSCPPSLLAPGREEAT